MRARNVKPGLFANEVLADTDAYTVLTFIGLWSLADREGRLEDRVRRIHLQLHALRGDLDETEKALKTLNDQGHIVRYQVGNERYIQVVNFRKHQRPHVREAASTIPPFDPAPAKDEPGTDQGNALVQPRCSDSGFSDSGFGSPLNPENGSSDSGLGSPLNADPGIPPAAPRHAEPEPECERAEEIEKAKKVIREPKHQKFTDHDLATVANVPVAVIREAKQQIRQSTRRVQ